MNSSHSNTINVCRLGHKSWTNVSSIYGVNLFRWQVSFSTSLLRTDQIKTFFTKKTYSGVNSLLIWKNVAVRFKTFVINHNISDITTRHITPITPFPRAFFVTSHLVLPDCFLCVLSPCCIMFVRCHADIEHVLFLVVTFVAHTIHRCRRSLTSLGGFPSVPFAITQFPLLSVASAMEDASGHAQ